ncbi:DUF6441 family protein [Hyphomonas pacifica]|uniref:Uncharacterized protein n=1 Tax=Hyphomonas pacifica TaxID=1280941 RepID=A0A8B2PQN0_9PROT|nr:DUF6441 family protein [Hyphomonas pacifica]RAN30636.1 hypothetical protein HY3_05660 [Hyphomonas pacifica]
MSELLYRAALDGGLAEFQDGVMEAVSVAGRETVETLRDMGLSKLRGSIRDAGLGDRLANAWRAEIYPKRGFALNPAILFWSKADVIVNAHQGETIHAKDGNLLAIPIPDGPAVDFPNPRGPDTKVDYARKKFGDRLFVIPANPVRPAILAAEGVGFTKTGRLTLRKQSAKTGKWGKGSATVFLFWLVEEAVLQQRLDVQADFDWIDRTFQAEYSRILADNMLRAGLAD